jgi:hypothetical protein
MSIANRSCRFHREPLAPDVDLRQISCQRGFQVKCCEVSFRRSGNKVIVRHMKVKADGRAIEEELEEELEEERSFLN